MNGAIIAFGAALVRVNEWTRLSQDDVDNACVDRGSSNDCDLESLPCDRQRTPSGGGSPGQSEVNIGRLGHSLKGCILLVAASVCVCLCLSLVKCLNERQKPVCEQ